MASVVALAGRRIDAVGAERRFPLGNVPIVRARIVEALKRLEVKSLVCSAACGADLIALQVAIEQNIPRRILLPFEPQKFRSSSVTDRPGNWGEIFDYVLEQTPSEDVVNLELTNKDPNKNYSLVTREIVKQTSIIAKAADLSPTTLLVWDSLPRHTGDATQDMLEVSKSAGFEVHHIQTGDVS
ncbi:hypothetical protein [Mesorhizobium sp. M0088]|uniref:hypothetical protein n=1 Tax=Mesorhizobium sp. M0088 TaxID=2956873 RepID=UPI0033380249